MYNRINQLLQVPSGGGGYGDQVVSGRGISNPKIDTTGSGSVMMFKNQSCLFNPLNIDIYNSVLRVEQLSGSTTNLSVSGNGIEALRSDPIPNHHVHPHESTSITAEFLLPPNTPQQEGQWQQRYSELVAFKEEHGHSCVPSHWPRNVALALWVKRQRSQFKLKEEGKHSNMTDARENALNALGFVWHRHTLHWEERWRELRDFYSQYGHSNVPTKFPSNKELAMWCKGQRRHFKLFQNGDARSTMTLERMAKLESLGFAFFLRKSKIQ